MENRAAAIDIGKVKAFLQKKEMQYRQSCEDEYKKTMQILKDLVDVWKQYNLKKVYLYGSIKTGRLHDESDIDIAVEGNINYQDLLRLFCEIDRHFAREVDLRSLEELPFKDAVQKNGVVIYEQ
jgi:predicted nucleotidyltransferase